MSFIIDSASVGEMILFSFGVLKDVPCLPYDFDAS